MTLTVLAPRCGAADEAAAAVQEMTATVCTSLAGDRRSASLVSLRKGRRGRQRAACLQVLLAYSLLGCGPCSVAAGHSITPQVAIIDMQASVLLGDSN